MPRYECPGCGGILPLTGAQLSRRIECGRCGTVFVPDPPPPEEDDYEPADEIAENRSATMGRWAVASLVIGSLAVVAAVVMSVCCPPLGIPLGVLAIVLGVVGRKSEHRGYANAGIATGIFAIVISIIASAVIWMLIG